MVEQRNQRIVETLNRRQPDLTVVMENVHKPHNLSAVARTCDGVGVGKIHAIVPRGSFRLGGKAASGVQKWVKAKYWRDTKQAVSVLQEQGFTVYAADIGERSIDYREIDYCQPSAILLGSELSGVSAEARACADYTVSVPLYGMVESLNVSVAAAVVLYEAARQRQARGFYSARRIRDETFSRLRFEWLHPTVARYCQKHGIDYPALAENGDIIESITGNQRAAYSAAIRDVS